jgi:hypothetical protein
LQALIHLSSNAVLHKIALGRILRCADCVKTAFTVRLSLTANAVVTLKIEYLSVRPEQRRRAPREFPHSLPLRMTLVGIVILNEVKDLV